MAKGRVYSIRWSHEDQRELSRVVKNFNAKLDRLAKKNPKNIPSLPDKLSVKDLKGVIKTRADFNREIKSLQRFTQRSKGKAKPEDLVDIPGNDNNIKITRWQKTEMNRRLAGINRRRENRLKEVAQVEMQYKGKELGYQRKDIGMGKNMVNQLKPLKAFTRSQTHRDIQKKFKTIMKESSQAFFNETDEILRENFMKSIEENFPSNDPRIKKILQSIEKADIKKFVKVWRRNGGNFETNYPLTNDETEEYTQYLEHVYGNL